MKLRQLAFFSLLFIYACQSAEKASYVFKEELSIEDYQKALTAGEVTVQEITAYYLQRIDSLDKNGPKLNSVLTLNPDAMAIAKKLDKELADGKSRGPLHGIPVLLKDNIDTKDKMPCTAGARAMRGSMPLKDSPLAAQLRTAGAVILGKANLSEWANFHSNQSSSGWSGLGGQTKNPYRLTHNPCGSSAGSGAAVSANLCAFAIGTETNGSIICPSHSNGIVGIKPTVGLISRSGIIPISHTQDTAGPMARSVKDAAMALGVLTSSDPTDDKTIQDGRVALNDYTPFCIAEGLKNKRIGYYKKPLSKDSSELSKIMQQTLADFSAQGATIVVLDTIIHRDTGKNSFQVLLYEFKDGLNKYLKGLGQERRVKTLDQLIELTFADSIEMKYHDHELLKTANEKKSLEQEEYKEALALALKYSREEGMDKVMDDHDLDAIIAPSGSPAWPTSLENGDTFGIFSSSPAAISGYPSITVPMGQIDGLPVGLSIFGKAWTEGKLIEVAYAFEQLNNHRIVPQFKKD